MANEKQKEILQDGQEGEGNFIWEKNEVRSHSINRP